MPDWFEPPSKAPVVSLRKKLPSLLSTGWLKECITKTE